MSEISKEAKDEAVRVYWSAGDPISNIAAALQRHMDATAAAVLERDTECERADAAEQNLAQLLSGLCWALAQEDASELRARVHALVDEYEDEP